MPERLLQICRFAQVLGRNRGFMVAIGVSCSQQSFRSCVATRVPCVATWFSSCKQLLSRDIVFFMSRHFLVSLSR